MTENQLNDNKILAEKILSEVGGSNNVSAVTHCATRLRFNLKDEKEVNDDKVKAIDGVLAVIHAGGQVQIVVGTKVAKVYDEILSIGGFERHEAIDENLDADSKTPDKKAISIKSVGNSILSYVSGSIIPCIPAMTAAALFKALQVMLGDTFHIIATDGSFYLFCTMLFNSFFYFMPIYIGYSAAKKLKATPVLGILAGAMLVVPDFLNLATTEGASFQLLGMNVPLLNYSQTLLPVLLTVWIMSYIERFFKKYIPDAVTTVFTPFLTILITAPLAYLFLAPLGNNLGGFIGNGLIFINSKLGIFGTLLLGASWNFLVMSGMHMVVVMVAISNLMTTGSDYTMVGAGAAQWAVLGMALGAFLRIRKSSDKSAALGALLTGFMGGITEPALYGIGLRYMRPLISMAIGGAVGGLYLGITHVGMFQVVMGGNFLTSFLAYVGNGNANVINCVIGSLLAFTVTAVLTYFWGFKKDEPSLIKDELSK